MANGPLITSAAGLRRIQIYILDENGVPTGNQSGADGYAGINMEGARSFALTVPDVRVIQHIGNDRVLAQDFLPPTEGVRGEIATAKQNLGLDALLTDTLITQIGETTVSGLATDKQGHEVDVCVVAYRQALDTSAGSSQVRRWQMHMIPICRIIPRGSSAEQDAADENRYTVVPAVATRYPSGHPFSAAPGEEGFTEAQYLRMTAEHPAFMERWTGDGTRTEFNLSWTPISVDKTYVEVNGTQATVNSTNPITKTMTLQNPPPDQSVVWAWYETTDGIG